MTNGNDSAYVNSEQMRSAFAVGVIERGLTKREYFAAMAMQGLMADSNIVSTDGIAETAVEMADALIEALNKEQAEAAFEGDER